jgi:cellulose synthase/poly-beta-1,6-N-acetylglucosamine synthase-like glycosyltransferase
MTRTRYQRFLEIIPGALVWTTLILSVVLSFAKPLWMVYIIIIFDLYWLLRIIYFIPFLLWSWWLYRLALKRDWQHDASFLPGYDSVRHLVFLPTYKEEKGVIRETLHSLMRCSYPAKRMIIVLAGEERDAENFQFITNDLVPQFAEHFGGLLTTIHPKNLPDEIPGKGSNLNWSANQVVPKLVAEGLDPEKTIVSSFDVDTIVHPQYFSALTWHYLTVPEPTRSSYQPVALYNNNLWESPAAVRVAMFGTTFWLMTELARPEGMMTFSSHSMSLRMLMDVGYWVKDMVSEDSHIFLQGLVHYHGRYRVTPVHLPVSMDTVMTGKYVPALGALYKQLRRWAWGVENFPYMVEAFSKDKEMPFRTKFWWLFKQVEGMYTWATAPFIVLILGYLPFWAAPEQLRSFAVFQNTPFTLEWLMRLSMVGLFVSAGLALTLLPPRPKHYSRPYAAVIFTAQWLLSPVTFVIFGALPALDAQTRLMFGKYLGFNVSQKRKVD